MVADSALGVPGARGVGSPVETGHYTGCKGVITGLPFHRC